MYHRWGSLNSTLCAISQQCKTGYTKLYSVLLEADKTPNKSIFKLIFRLSLVLWSDFACFYSRFPGCISCSPLYV